MGTHYIIESTSDPFVKQESRSVLWEFHDRAGDATDLEASLKLLEEVREKHRTSLNPRAQMFRFRLVQISVIA
jgi:hypothetical protein